MATKKTNKNVAGQMSFAFLEEEKENHKNSKSKKRKTTNNLATAKNKGLNPLLYYPPIDKTTVAPTQTPIVTIDMSKNTKKEKEIEVKMEKEKSKDKKEEKTTSKLTKMEVQELFELCKKEVKDAGIEIGNVYATIKVNSRFSKKWGVCKRRNNIYYIEIADRLLVADENSIKTTIIHELLHTVKGCFNHGLEWKKVANIMNRKYGYNIKRTTSDEEKGLEIDWDAFKYIVKCKNCENTFGYTRKTKCIQYLSHYRCGKCKGKLEVLKSE